MTRPPKIAEILIKACQNDDDSYQSLGDFEEVFNDISNEEGVIRAHLWYWSQLIKSIPDFFETSILWGFTMFKSYLKIAYRNLLKNKVYSVINIAGLSIGLACTILILYYVKFETSYDKYHENADRTYRIVQENWTGVSVPLVTAIKSDFPEVEAAVMTDYHSRNNKKLFGYGEKRFYEDKFLLAGDDFFRLFSYQFLYGDPGTALNEPASVVLTESTSRKYFGEGNPVGKVLSYENEMNLIVTGVVKDVQQNSHFVFDLLGSFNNINNYYKWDYSDQWGSMNFQSYLLLFDNSSIEAVENRINNILKEKRGEYQRHHSLQLITDIHLKPKTRGEYGRRGNILHIYYYIAITFVILLVASINFTNLATAHSLKRAREVGLKKVFGAKKYQLVKQYMGEAILISCISIPAAIFMSKLFYPYFKEITGLPVDLIIINNLNLVIMLIGIALLAGVISGSYPGFFASSLKPVKIFRQRVIKQSGGMSLRNVLLLVQFTISVFAISCLLIVSGQITYIKNKDLGMDKDQILIVDLSRELSDKYPVIKNELSNLGIIKDLTGISNLPSDGGYYQTAWWEGQEDPDEGEMMRWMWADKDYFNTFGTHLLEFDENLINSLNENNRGYILNETAARYIGLENPVGKSFTNRHDNSDRGKIVGIVRDFHYKSLHHMLEPYYIKIGGISFYHLAIKLNTGDMSRALDQIGRVWNETFPNRPFVYSFFDEDFERMYKSESRMSKVFNYFSFIAILLACMGLFGLTAFVVENKTKEIGIRKVLGSSVPGIIKSISMDFILLILGANVLAWPIAYYLMNKWLVNFAYKIDIGIVTFISAGLAVFILAIITISVRTVKAAYMNPVDVLRYE